MHSTGSGGSYLLEAILPDPCFWTPDLPHLYDVHLEVTSGGEVVHAHDQQLGIRRLGVRGRDLVLESRRTVLRAVGIDSVTEPSSDTDQLLSMCHDAPAALLVENPSDDFCQKASLLGVLLIVTVDETPENTISELHRLSRWAAVAIVVLPTTFRVTAAPRVIPRNLLLGQRITDTESSSLAAWADVALVDSINMHRALDATIPVLAYRRLTSSLPIAEARRACDHLQRDLATQGDFAGYIV